MSRFDYIFLDLSLFDKVSSLTEEDREEISGLEFQTKDLQREFLEYFVDSERQLHYEDFHYELVDSNNDGLFSRLLRKVDDGVHKDNFTGVIMFYGKPYEKMYTFHAKFTNGELKYVRLLSIK